MSYILCMTDDRTGQPPMGGEGGWILCGQINLHKSPACAAQLVSYLNAALNSATLEQQGGNIRIASPCASRSPQTVSEWREMETARIAGGQAGSGVTDSVVDPTSDDQGRFSQRLNRFLREARVETVERTFKKPEAFIFAVSEPHSKKDHLSNCS